MPMLVQLDEEQLSPLVRKIVVETVAQLEAARPPKVDDKLCYSEEEAAAMLGLAPYSLRDERRRGRVTASKIAGKRVRYLLSDLTAYLAKKRLNEAPAA